MRFIDKVKVFVKAGDGGRGCLSFLREKYREYGGPNGGNGGRGGSVVFVADINVGTLLDFSYKPKIIARTGESGKGANKTGADSEDTIVRVPIGTLVYKGGRLAADLSKEGARVCVAKGGRGGRGNRSFKNRFNTAPRIYEKGQPGEEFEVELELKLIADVGLAGFPNAGKSTLLSRLSNARPKVADYPFTTLSPNLGLVGHKGKSFVMADIPGLIEGAHAGKGLGGDFLRHVERTRVLIHVIDPMGFEKVSAVEGIKKIEEELRHYSRKLATKPKILAINKQDLPEGKEVLQKVRARYRKRNVFGISAVTGEGLDTLLDAALAELKKLPQETLTFESKIKESSVKIARGFNVARIGHRRFQVTGEYIERVASMTDASLIESMYRFQQTLRRVGVDRALKSEGVRPGDMVELGPLELEWSDAAAVRPPKLSKRTRPR